MEINARYQRQLDGLHRRFYLWQIAAVVRGYQDERTAALLALRERRATKAFSDRAARKAADLRPPRPP